MKACPLPWPPEAVLSGQLELQFVPPADAKTGRVPDFGYNPLYRLGLLYRPVLDEQTPCPVSWPEGAPFAVCLTHDLDVVSLAGVRQSIRKIIRTWRSQPRPSRMMQSLQTLLALRRLAQALARGPRSDPLWCYERWLEAEDRLGVRSTFFIFPAHVGRSHFSDCHYAYQDRIRFRRQRCRVADLIRTLVREGWEVGVHPSWNAATDEPELRQQKESVEEAAGTNVVSVRHHWLRFDLRTTPRLHAMVGLRYDSSLGFNDNVGFRFGTCRPWWLRDPAAATPLRVLEIPLIAQDTALLNAMKGLRLNLDGARSYLRQLTDEVEKVGGVFTLSFHPDGIDASRCPGWFELYCDVIAELKTRRAWFATIGELGRLWESACAR